VANKRISLQDRKGMDSLRGVDSIIQTSESPQEVTQGVQIERIKETFPLAKVTIYIRPEQVVSIEEIQVLERKRTGKKKDKSELVQEAIDLLIQQYTKE
jgi:hypothetical protein